MISSIAFSGGAPSADSKPPMVRTSSRTRPRERALDRRGGGCEVGAEDAVAALGALGFVPFEVAFARDRLGEQAPTERQRARRARDALDEQAERRLAVSQVDEQARAGHFDEGREIGEREAFDFEHARAESGVAQRFESCRDFRARHHAREHVGRGAILADQLPVDEDVVEVEGRLVLDLEGHRLRDAAALAEREVDRAPRDAIARDRRDHALADESERLGAVAQDVEFVRAVRRRSRACRRATSTVRRFWRNSTILIEWLPRSRPRLLPSMGRYGYLKTRARTGVWDRLRRCGR